MRGRTLARGTTLEVSEVGVAVGALVERTMRWPDEAVALLEAAIGDGFTFFDASPGPRQEPAERLLGAALRGRREGVIVASAFAGRARGPLEDEREPDWSVRAVERAIDASLSRLGVDPIDCWQLARPPKAAVQSDELFSFLDGQVAKGKLRAYGLTVANDPGARVVDEAMDVLDRRSFASVQVTETAFQAARTSLLDVARGTATAVLVRQSGGDRPALSTVERAATARGQTPAQVALAHLLADPEVASVLVAVRDAAHLGELAAAGDGPALTPDELESIREEATASRSPDGAP